MEQEIDWSNLGFGYIQTDVNIRCSYKNGEWGELRETSDTTIPMHIAATCLHYGQQIFEGQKVFRGPDGQLRVFRIEDNARRMQDGCEGLLMPPFPVDKFVEAVRRVVKANERFIPPYESGASLYLRPLVIGTSAQVGVSPAKECEFILFATPVGPYFKGGFQTTPFVILRGYDRAAPLGTGTFKCGGNYAASLRANEQAHKMGYSNVFYIDAREKKYIDECGAANFFGIKENTYVTPKSTSVLPSITNRSLMQLAEDMGLKVEMRQIPVEELAEMQEAGACGTAAVISPISYIDDADTNVRYTFSKDGKPGPVCTKLYETLRGIQYGIVEDKHNWITIL